MNYVLQYNYQYHDNFLYQYIVIYMHDTTSCAPLQTFAFEVVQGPLLISYYHF